MEQYWRTFTSYREPGTPRDIQHTKTHLSLLAGKEHITVLCRNQVRNQLHQHTSTTCTTSLLQCFEVTTVDNGQRLPQAHIAQELQAVMELAERNENHSSFTPVNYMTTADRDTAAAVQQILLQSDKLDA